ncbi:hypothetical protein BCR34DRAFT_527338 [Clohesyomyces aquaticus]|uniref:RWD domain-containing protein n=1 Tax=Clohesyomyces aquaticus TaxID=1231657 RepID=A0A1Y2ABU3_9PLEO|nr:hypothetical protein BCR34DRAFT_527338 [Clohesyomyces aquaticus]
MSQPENSRLTTELNLLQAMYPDQIDFVTRSRDLKFTTDISSVLQLRLPETYPDAGLPHVLLASDGFKNDIRDRVKASVAELGLPEGEEALDAIIACFQSVVAETNAADELSRVSRDRQDRVLSPEPSKTVVIWLHHLLAQSKRKLALSPPPNVAGVTKPGYPGVLVFTGPSSAVTEHVNTLKAENWQAFQVRLESAERWHISHGAEVREVETMAEVVKSLEVGLQSARIKDDFLKAVGIK